MSTGQWLVWLVLSIVANFLGTLLYVKFGRALSSGSGIKT